MDSAVEEQQIKRDVGIVLRTLLTETPECEPADVVARFVQLRKKAFTFRKVAETVKIQVPGMPQLKVKYNGRGFVGGGGIVCQCEPKGVDGVQYALKVTRPSLFDDPKNAPLEFDATFSEYIKHAPISHQNIVRVFFGVNLQVTTTADKQSSEVSKCPTMLMEWLDDAKPLGEWLVERANNYSQVLHVLLQVFEGLDYLHHAELIHWDIKSDNILVDKNGVVKIADLGNSRRRTPIPSDSETVQVQTTEWNLPLTLYEKLGHDSGTKRDSKRVTLDVETRWNTPLIDLFMLGKELNRLFGAELDLLSPGDKGARRATPLMRQQFLSRCFPDTSADASFVLSCLRLTIRRILRGDHPDRPAYYQSAKAVASDLRKIEPEFGAAQSIPELHSIPQHVIRIPCWGNVAFTDRVGRLLNSAVIQRLSRHHQLATLIHVYPGASHRRSEHVTGVMAAAAQYVRSLYADRSDPFWRLSVQASDVIALLLGAVLHDMGHIAFGHFLEEMDEVFSKRMHEDYAVAVLDPGRPGNFTHRETIERDRVALLQLAGEWSTDGLTAEELLLKVAELIRPSERFLSSAAFSEVGVLDKSTTDEIKIQILHSIIDSAIDADKLDYLMRDAHHCGVKYAMGIDLERFFQTLTTITRIPDVFREDTGQKRVMACIGVSRKGVLPVESILLARFQMFGAVYWQHTARAETAMLQFLVEQYVAGGGPDNNETRLEEIITNFRVLNDSQALRWLQEVVATKNPGSEKTRNRLSAIGASLIERSNIYWMAVEVEYSAPKYPPEKISGVRETDRSIEELYLAIVSDPEDKEDGCSSTTLASALKECGRLREGVTHALKRDLAKNGAKNVAIEQGEVLVDRAPPGKDQVENIFVRSDGAVLAIQNVSAIAEAIRTTFNFWARRLRVFVAPAFVERLRLAGVEWSQVKACSQNALKVALVEEVKYLSQRRSHATFNRFAAEARKSSVGHGRKGSGSVR
jgi:HD superfamily phosphohydrolase